MKRILTTCALAGALIGNAAAECFIPSPKAPQTCVVDAETLNRSVVQYGDDSRLWRVFQKAEAGKPIVVAAIGGSITQGAWATAQDKNYVSRVFGWWQATFPQSKMKLV